MTNKSKAILSMLLSSLMFALMSAMVKLAGDLPTSQKVFFRGIVSATVLFFIVKRRNASFFGKKSSQPYLLGRSLLGSAAMFLFYYGVSRIYVADASMIAKLNPFFVTLFAWFFLKEKLSVFQIPALVVVFLASLLIIKPKFDLEALPAFAVLIAAGLSGGAHTLLRAMNNKERPITIVFYFSLVTTLLMTPFVIVQFEMPDAAQWFYLIAIGALAAFSQIFLTDAYRRAKASDIVIYSYTNIIFAAVFGYIFWHEVSDWLSIIGGSIIIFVSFLLFLNQRRIARKERFL